MSDEFTKNQPTTAEAEAKEKDILLAAEIVQEAIKISNISKFFSGSSEFSNSRWDVFYQGEGKETALSLRLHGSVAAGWFHIPIVNIVWVFLNEVKSVLSDPDATKILLSSDTTYEEAVYSTTFDFAFSYITNTPTIIFDSLNQAVKEAIISQLKKFTEPKLRDHWDKLGLPKDFSLVSNNKLRISELFPNAKVDLLNYLEYTLDEFSVYRKSIVSDRKVLLSPQSRANLPAEYERLRLEYSKMKKEYKTQRTAFFTVHRRATIDDWEKHWEEFCEEKFPDLYLSSEFQSSTPAELTYEHLAKNFDFSASYMENIVRSARKQSQEYETKQRENQQGKTR